MLDEKTATACWGAVFGAAIARQVFDRRAQGGGDADDRALLVYVDEALVLANRAVEALVVVTTKQNRQITRVVEC